jgi:hypothetical protein
MKNWRRQYGRINCLVANYERTGPTSALPLKIDFCSNCRYRFHPFNEGLGGTISQIMYGMVAAKRQNLTFCLSSALIDPEPSHMNEYSWFQNILPLVRCHKCDGICDVDVVWSDNFWYEIKNVPLHFRNLYPEIFNDALNYLNLSALNKKFENCVHVRTGDLNEIPMVPWKNKDIMVFGEDGSHSLDFCNRNNCKFVNKTNVEFDFINLAGCQNLLCSPSSLCTIANIFNPLHYNRVHQSRGKTGDFYGVSN